MHVRVKARQKGANREMKSACITVYTLTALNTNANYYYLYY